MFFRPALSAPEKRLPQSHHQAPAIELPPPAGYLCGTAMRSSGLKRVPWPSVAFEVVAPGLMSLPAGHALSKQVNEQTQRSENSH